MVANGPPVEQHRATPGCSPPRPTVAGQGASRLGTWALVIAALFAHQGGWDEAIFVAVPIAIFAGLLLVANKRASRIEDERKRGTEQRKPRSGR